LPERRVGLPWLALSERLLAHRRRHVVKEILDRVEGPHDTIVTRCRPPLSGRFTGGRHHRVDQHNRRGGHPRGHYRRGERAHRLGDQNQRVRHTGDRLDNGVGVGVQVRRIVVGRQIDRDRHGA
jgi:hypothetical protein